ncbi:serine-rich adhesin for platelets [Daktulosphaira vitifoliae]|uniref:serine-rich adhesin for platelets n=1 Tax=Daktulosphaira vitifoliae TaxID=58002 RepID=UPI0021A97970|nr:serine-rich adhesin for platelets [Daktulosphaira vitifoliae]
MSVPRTLCPILSRWKIISILFSFIILINGHPLKDQKLESAVEGIQKYLESSGFPKMTRGEVLEFLNDFSHSSRVSRSDASKDKKSTSVTSPIPIVYMNNQVKETNTVSIPEGQSPLSYGYPASMDKTIGRTPTTEPPMIFVTVQSRKTPAKSSKSLESIPSSVTEGELAAKKNIGPSIDLNAYATFKKIPEGRSAKIEDVEMKSLLASYGLLDTPKVPMIKPIEVERRKDDNDLSDTETMDEKVLKTVLLETGNGNVNVSEIGKLFDSVEKSTRNHVFNPSDSSIKTLDVNKIAKIVQNIKLLADDKNTITLSQEAIQKKLQNITEAIKTIDEPSSTENSSFTGYEVFFDDNSKEIDSDLPAGSTEISVKKTEPLIKAQNIPDPLSMDELQQLAEKNKIEFKRQEPENATETTTTTTTSTTIPTTITTEILLANTDTSTSSETPIDVTTSTVTDSSSEASSVEVTSDSSERNSLTAVATDANPSISQLAESFGGGETASEPPPAVNPVTSSPKSGIPRNGLYFYVDWNSFLTVNEGSPNQVNLRFAPKAGNPAHFLKVTVP